MTIHCDLHEQTRSYNSRELSSALSVLPVISSPFSSWQARMSASCAASAVYLASEASSFMTGSVLVLDGGKLLW